MIARVKIRTPILLSRRSRVTGERLEKVHLRLISFHLPSNKLIARRSSDDRDRSKQQIFLHRKGNVSS